MIHEGPPGGHPRFDDFEVGTVYRSYGRTVTETDLVTFTSFAGLRLPVFIDDEYARHELGLHSPGRPLQPCLRL